MLATLPLAAAYLVVVSAHPQAGPPCPGTAEVTAALGRALPGWVPGVEGTRVEVADRGPRYRVVVKGSEREFTDEGRRCGERARAAAVFAALVLQPPWVAEEAPAEQPPAPPPALPAPVRTGSRMAIDLGAAGFLAVAPRTGRGEDSPLSGGAALRLGLRWGALGAALGLAGVSPVALRLSQQAGEARLLRLPLSLSGQAARSVGRAELSGEAGVVLALLLIRGVGLPGAPQGDAARLEPDLRAAVRLRVRAHPRLLPFVALEAQIAPRPYELVVQPQVVGQTPLVWVLAALGLDVALR